MILDAIKRFFGFHVHTWGEWYPIYAADKSEVGKRRKCSTCPAIQNDHYPEGH